MANIEEKKKQKLGEEKTAETQPRKPGGKGSQNRWGGMNGPAAQ